MNRAETRNQIRARLAQGQKTSRIAADLGVARSTVHRIKGKAPARKGERAAYLAVGTRVTEAEIAPIDAIVETHADMTRSKMLRKLVRSAGGFAALDAGEECLLRGFDASLSRLGGNFNQIAAALSASVNKTGRADPTRVQVQAILAAEQSVAELRMIVRHVLDNSQVKAVDLIALLDALEVDEHA